MSLHLDHVLYLKCIHLDHNCMGIAFNWHTAEANNSDITLTYMLRSTYNGLDPASATQLSASSRCSAYSPLLTAG